MSLLWLADNHNNNADDFIQFTLDKIMQTKSFLVEKYEYISNFYELKYFVNWT